MEPISAAAITSLLVTYAHHLAGIVGEVVDEGLTERLRSMWDAVRSRFSGDEQATGALDRVADQPDNERRQAALEDHLDELMQADAGFAAALAALAEQVRASGPTSTTIDNAGAVAIGGDVTIRGGRYTAGRDVTITETRTGSRPPAV